MDPRAALELQIAWGAGVGLAATPRDWSRPDPPVLEPAAPTVVASRPAPDIRHPAGDRQDVPPGDFAALRDAIAAYDCPLRATVTRVVLPDGPPDARLLIIGEPPDGEADEAGRPYAGAAGAALAAWLGAIGLSRPDVLVMAALPWRPPGARPPTPAEEAQAKPFVRHALTLSSATDVLVLGPLAAKLALDGPRKLGAQTRLPRRILYTLPGLAEIARRPAQKRLVWAALRHVRRSLDKISA